MKFYLSARAVFVSFGVLLPLFLKSLSALAVAAQVLPEKSVAPASPLGGATNAVIPALPESAPESKNANRHEAEPLIPKVAERDILPTPDWLKEKLTVAAGLGLGMGSGPVSGAKSDKLGYHFAALYSVAEAPFLTGASYLTELHFAWSSSVDASAADRSFVNQFFLVGGGLELEIEEVEGMRLAATALVGVSRSPGYSFAASAKEASSRVGFNGGLQAKLFYQLLPSVEVYSGVGSQIGSASWMDFQIGLAGTF